MLRQQPIEVAIDHLAKGSILWRRNELFDDSGWQHVDPVGLAAGDGDANDAALAIDDGAAALVGLQGNANVEHSRKRRCAIGSLPTDRPRLGKWKAQIQLLAIPPDTNSHRIAHVGGCVSRLGFEPLKIGSLVRRCMAFDFENDVVRAKGNALLPGGGVICHGQSPFAVVEMSAEPDGVWGGSVSHLGNNADARPVFRSDHGDERRDRQILAPDKFDGGKVECGKFDDGKFDCRDGQQGEVMLGPNPLDLGGARRSIVKAAGECSAELACFGQNAPVASDDGSPRSRLAVSPDLHDGGSEFVSDAAKGPDHRRRCGVRSFDSQAVRQGVPLPPKRFDTYMPQITANRVASEIEADDPSVWPEQAAP